jgi:ABC-2 type transport system ATP-binding protein
MNGDSTEPLLPAIVVDDVRKSFRLPREQMHTLKERALHPFRRQEYDLLEALRGVSFQVEPSEFFGIVGRNGSGKSTLLKCMAGIYRTAGGDIYVNGRMSAFIELGVGFNPDLPARDNILINATMLGLEQKDARSRVDAILDFAELHEFVDLKLKNYSSGMMVRLAFSVMIQVDADILLIDEVLAVGDAAFQQKCYDEFERIRQEGKTVLLVTHDMASVRRFCDRALLLEHGKIVAIGDPERVGNRYLELNFSEDARSAQQDRAPEAAPEELASGQGDRVGDGRAEILDAWFETPEGQRTEALQSGRAAVFGMRVRFQERVEDPLFSVELVNSQRHEVFAASSYWTDPKPGVYDAGEEVVVRVSFRNLLAPDRYHATVSVEQENGRHIDRRMRMVPVMVTSTRRSGALVEIPYELSVERSSALRQAV